MTFPSITRDNTMTSHRLPLWIALALALAFGVTACGDDNASPSDDGDNIIDVPDSGSTGGTGGSTGGTGGDTGGTGGDTGGSGGAGGDDDDGGVAGDGGGALIDTGVGIDAGDRPDCDDTTNDTHDSLPCWNLTTCVPKDTEHFLGQCGDNCYAPFDNEARIEGYTGTLPPLN